MMRFNCSGTRLPARAIGCDAAIVVAANRSVSTSDLLRGESSSPGGTQ